MQRTFREVMFLQDLNNHDNIIRWGLQQHPAGVTKHSYGPSHMGSV